LTSPRLGRRPDERGVVLPTGLMVGSIIAVALAAVAFVLTAHPPQNDTATTVARPVTPSRTVTATPKPHKPKPKPKPAVKRGQIYVEVYNNSNIHGLAGQTAARAQSAGWNVVGSDNWYGTVEASTVYYPQRLSRAAHLLAKDLDIKRLRTAISPMRLDRLTVILTGDVR